MIDATARTNAYRSRWQVGDEITVKLRPGEIHSSQDQRPRFEIFVCSPKVEGVHLRGGPIARGGLGWRRKQYAEDLSEEILGLMKAQMVKNAVIVPVGAKGGFVVKGSNGRPRPTGMRFVRKASTGTGASCEALLDVTDTWSTAWSFNPADCVVQDEPDPYLVVAADKGTASFSDIANEIAIDRPASGSATRCASGGSNGYDHKGDGDHGARRLGERPPHGHVLGLDVDRDPITVVGIGDMSGDVFGNGMLLSDNLRLVAAFDHRRIFLDPEPPGARTPNGDACRSPRSTRPTTTRR